MKPATASSERFWKSFAALLKQYVQAQLAPLQAELVQLRYFGGLNNREASAVLKVSEATVERDWRFAKAWMTKELRDARGPDAA